MARERQNDALQTIFSFFLGLMVLAFIGVGVNTFYPSPTADFDQRQQALFDKQSTIGQKFPGGVAPTPQQQAEAAKIQSQINALQRERQRLQSGWQSVTSIVLILFATAVMAISLIRSEQLKVISNGLLLGGLFTMVYGTGWTIASGDSKVRFVVITFALVVTLALGYLKFVRPRMSEPEAGGGRPAEA